MPLLDTLERWITGVPAAGLCAILVCLNGLRAGVWTIPSISSLNTLALDPFSNPYEGPAQYLFANWFGPFLAWLLGLTGRWSFILLHAGFSALFLVTVALSLRRSLPEPEWRKAICIFAILPVSWVHFYWIGYDSLTLTLMALAMAALRTPVVASLFGVMLGLQHFEQSLIGFLALFAVVAASIDGRSSDQRRALFGAAAVVAGILAGKAVLWGIIRANHLTLTFDRSAYLTTYLGDAIRASAYGLPFILASALGVGWVLVAVRVGRGRRSWAFRGVLLGGLATSLLTFDNTRVFACVTFPTLAFCWLYDREWLSRVPLRLVAMLLLAWVVTPWMFAWGARPRLSVLPYDLAVLSHNLVESPTLPAPPDRPMWPFLP